ncbi:MAG: hypothetical protein WC208_14145 [Gallionella sp.]|jgi:hypothetical protein
MTDKVLQKKMDSIKKNMKLFDDILGMEFKTGKAYISKKQGRIIRKLLSLFREMRWHLAFTYHKKLITEDTKPINQRGCGTPVKIRPCGAEYKNKTYFGILLGDMALQIHHSIDAKGNMTASHSFYNPAIFVPELKKIIYGCESWWGEIEKEEDLKEIISDDTIGNVWYVKLLKVLTPKKEGGDTSVPTK